MAVTLYMLRMKDNLARMEADKLKVLQITRELNNLTNFSSAIGDGTITPDEIATIGSEYFSDAIDFMGYSNDSAIETAQEQADIYAGLFGDITASEYYQNSSLMSQAQLYFDEDGSLDVTQIESNLYEQALKEYAEEYIAPILSKKETELQNEKDRLETEIERLEAEYDQLKEAKSQDIQRQTISLS